VAADIGLAAVLVLGVSVLGLNGCSDTGNDASAYAPACQPFDPDVTHSCVISSQRWSEIAELPEPPGMYRYCAWPGLFSGAYRTRYRDLDGTLHDLTEAPTQTPGFLLEALRGADNAPMTTVVDYRMIPTGHPCPNTPPP